MQCCAPMRPVRSQKLAFTDTAAQLANPIGDQTTVVRLVADQAFYVRFGDVLRYDITAITQANPAVVTSAGHKLANGQTGKISGVVGMTEVNGNAYTVANAAANTFQLNGTNSTGYTAYESGGVFTADVPAATDADIRIPANVPCYFRVSPGQSLSALRVGDNGTLNVAEMAQ